MLTLHPKVSTLDATGDEGCIKCGVRSLYFTCQTETRGKVRQGTSIHLSCKRGLGLNLNDPLTRQDYQEET